MALPELPLDTRTYRDIVAEALARVPVHTPEWNNLGDSDPGVTLLQVFAFIAESAIYRANRIPLRNRRKFLRMLGVALREASAASGLVSFTSPLPLLLDSGLRLAAGSVPFVTTTGLKALPVESRLYSKQRLPDARRAEVADRYNRLYASIREPAQVLDFYETRPLTPPVSGTLAGTLDLTATVDRCLWIALFAPPRQTPDAVRALIAGQPLTLGIAPALDGSGQTLFPAGPPAAATRPSLVYEMPDPNATTPVYRALQVLSSDDVLAAPGVVELQLPAPAALGSWSNLGPLQSGVGGYPPALDNSQDLQRLVTWIRIRVPPSDGSGPGGSQAQVQLSWVGVNAARVLQKVAVQGERLPDGTGQPDQVAKLANGNVLPDGLQLTVNGAAWTRVDDLADAAPEVPPRAPRQAPAPALASQPSTAFTLDAASGEIVYKARPPRGALIVCSYHFGGGLAGGVAIGAIARIVNGPAGLTVTNPIPTWGAADAESVADAELRIPQFVRHREVAASREDFDKIVRRTPGVDVGRVEVLPLVHPDLPNQPADGNVTVVVIPGSDSLHPAAPQPDARFLQTVCDYLAPRRVLTTQVHVLGATYRRIGLGIGIQAVPGRAEGPLAEQVRSAVLAFLSPLAGGFDQQGWPLGRAVDAAEIQAVASRTDGVASVTGIVLVDADGQPLSSPVALAALELPQIDPLSVAVGAAPNPVAIAPPDAVSALPVPVVPESC